jgi:nucleolar protein 4
LIFFTGRQIAVDWAIPKTQYAALNNKTAEEVEIPSVEPSAEKDENKDESDDEEDEDVDEDDDEEGQDEEASDSEVGSDLGDEESPIKEKVPWKGDNSEIERKSDVEEGKTIFIRNLDFSTTKDSLKNFMEKFGSVHYALLCIDKVMERPKGTGFVKFTVSRTFFLNLYI